MEDLEGDSLVHFSIYLRRSNGRISTQKRCPFVSTIKRTRAKGLKRPEYRRLHCPGRRGRRGDQEAPRRCQHVTKPAVGTQTNSLFVCTIEPFNRVVTSCRRADWGADANAQADADAPLMHAGDSLIIFFSPLLISALQCVRPAPYPR